MASVYRTKGAKGYTVSWYDSTGKRNFRRGLPTSQIARQIGDKHELRKTMAKHGLLDKDTERRTNQADRPLKDHLEEFAADIRAKGNTAKYVTETIDIINRVFAAAGVGRIDEFDDQIIRAGIVAMKPRRKVMNEKLSHRTMNRALSACKTFANFLTPKRIPSNPLYRMKGWDVERDRRRIRVAMTESQIMDLIEATPTQKTRGGMTGIDRMMRYALGVGTGLRQGTLFSLTPESFHLDDAEPFIHIESENIKSRKTIDHAITPELVEMLRPWLATRPKRKPIFPKLKWADPMTAYRQDLKAAGIKYHDPETVHYCDQHAQRNAFITEMIRVAGLKVAQDMAHHSTPTLTSKYARLGMSDYAKALKDMPKLRRQVGAKKKIG